MGSARSKVLLGAAGGGLGVALWWRFHPSACPYSQRFWIQAPHPFITRERLRLALEPKPGERLLEVGPGTGYYTLPVAEWLSPGGLLDVVDVQQEMLDHTLRRTREQGITNIVPTLADARELPFDDEAFDGAYLCAVLGEIPDQEAALRELARVVRRGGRLVVGEILFDPHVVTLGALRRRAEAAGFRFERQVGPALGWFARFGLA